MSNDRKLRYSRMTVGRYMPPERAVPAPIEDTDVDDLHAQWDAEQEFLAESDAFDSVTTSIPGRHG